MRRIVILILGYLFLILGILGLVLPILPGSVLLYISLVCFDKSSKRVHSWLINNKWFGYYFKKLAEGKGVPLKAKVVLVVYILGCIVFNIIFLVSALTLKIIAIIFGLVPIIYILWLPTLKK